MDYILIEKVYRDKGREFHFPQDLLQFLDNGVTVYINFELEKNKREWTSIETTVIEETILENSLEHFYLGCKDLDRMDPWERAMFTTSKDSIWMKKEDVDKLFSPIKESLLPSQKSVKNPGSRSNNHTIEILSVTIQLLTEELELKCPESRFLKGEAPNRTLNITKMAQEIVDQSTKWWVLKDDGSMPFGKAATNIENNIGEALKFPSEKGRVK